MKKNWKSEMILHYIIPMEWASPTMNFFVRYATSMWQTARIKNKTKNGESEESHKMRNNDKSMMSVMNGSQRQWRKPESKWEKNEKREKTLWKYHVRRCLWEQWLCSCSPTITWHISNFTFTLTFSSLIFSVSLLCF